MLWLMYSKIGFHMIDIAMPDLLYAPQSSISISLLELPLDPKLFRGHDGHTCFAIHSETGI